MPFTYTHRVLLASINYSTVIVLQSNYFSVFANKLWHDNPVSFLLAATIATWKGPIGYS